MVLGLQTAVPSVAESEWASAGGSEPLAPDRRLQLHWDRRRCPHSPQTLGVRSLGCPPGPQAESLRQNRGRLNK